MMINAWTAVNVTEIIVKNKQLSRACDLLVDLSLNNIHLIHV